MKHFPKKFLTENSGAVTVDWVVLSAAVVGLMAAGYFGMKNGTIDVATRTADYMKTSEF